MAAAAQANPAISNAAFADALNRARQLAAKIGSGEKRPLEDGEGNAAKRPNNDGGVPIATLGGPSSGMDPVIVENYQVPDAMVGLIIGRGGEQITNIQAQTNCRVQMAPDAESAGLPERPCTLTGSAQAIQAAKDMINQIIAKGNTGGSNGGVGNGGMMGNNIGQPVGNQRVEEIMLPGSKVGLVIGKGGENLKKIQEQLGVRMIVIQDSNQSSMHDKPLRIIGSPESVDMAKQRIIEVMNSKDNQGNSIGGGGGGGSFGDYGSGQRSMGEVIVPRLAVGVIIGKGGDMIKKIQQETSARVQFKMGEDTNGPERTAVLTGTPEQIQKATAMITELVNQAVLKSQGQGGVGGAGGNLSFNGNAGGGRQEIFYMHVPANKTGLVIGRGGENIRQINTESMAHVELSREPQPNDMEKIFIIKGNSQQIHHAQHLIRIKVGDIPPGTPVPPFQPQQHNPQNAAPIPSAPQHSGYPGGHGGHQMGGPPAQPAAAPAAAYNPYPTPGGAAPAAPQPAPTATPTAQDPNAAAWAAYYAQYYQQPGYQAGQPQQPTPAQPQPAAAVPTSQPQPVTQASQAPAVNPVTGQPDYSAQWADYYRSLGMHEQAQLIEQQAKANQAAAAQAVNPAAHSQPQAQPSYATYAQQPGYPGIPGQQAYQQYQ